MQVTLDGLWEFFYSPQGFKPGETEIPAVEEFTGKMVIPGYWDDHYELYDEEDFFGLTARFNPDYRKPHFPCGRSMTPHAATSFLIGTGFYRRLYLAPQLEKDDIVTLKIGPAMWGVSLYCNRKLAGFQTGYSTESTFRLDGLLKPGAENELIIVVCNRHDDGGAYFRLDESHDGEAFGARPGQHRGLAAQGYQSERAGIGGGPSLNGTVLEITRKNALKDWALFSQDNGKLLWDVSLQNAAGTRLRWSILDGDATIASGDVPLNGQDFRFETDAPQLEAWSDRAPRLYGCRLEIFDGETLLDEETHMWGYRQIKCRGTQILLNGKPTFLRGETEHCYFPETANPHFDKAKYLHDLGVLKQAGFNFIRCHTWCPPEAFYDACDELGFVVQTEIPSVYSFAEAEAIIRQIRHHACAMILCEGNEKVIDDKAIERLRKVHDILVRLAPGALFNPQEASRGIEYATEYMSEIVKEPFPHDQRRLDMVGEFSDVYGALGQGYFSYSFDCFPGSEEAEYRFSCYKKPCLCHELGILGGYLDFSLEKRYEGTFIGTDMFAAAREHMQKHGVYDRAAEFFEKNTRFISSCRKQLVENIRSCKSVAGYDYLGAIDTHWHLIGYPCGIFNEFYEEKPHESIADVRRYNGESVLLCATPWNRSKLAGTSFAEPVKLSYYGEAVEKASCLRWAFCWEGEAIPVANGMIAIDKAIEPGNIVDLAEIRFDLPALKTGRTGILSVRWETPDQKVENQWTFWSFPQEEKQEYTAKCVTQLTPELVKYLEEGGAVLLTDKLPGETMTENFRPQTSGRCLGHAGTILNPHPIWKDFPQSGIADWHFLRMMTKSTSMVHENVESDIAPIMELIPAFKMVKHKRMVEEYSVGKGRLIMCGLRLEDDDIAAQWLKRCMLKYLSNPAGYVPAQELTPAALLELIQEKWVERKEKLLDAGGRPIEKKN